MTVTDLLTAGVALQVDLLTELPDSTDPATWSIASWGGYQPLLSIPTLTLNQGGNVIGFLRGPALSPGNRAVAFAARYQGMTVFTGPILPPNVNVSGLLTVEFAVQPWFGGGT